LKFKNLGVNKTKIKKMMIINIANINFSLLNFTKLIIILIFLLLNIYLIYIEFSINLKKNDKSKYMASGLDAKTTKILTNLVKSTTAITTLYCGVDTYVKMNSENLRQSEEFKSIQEELANLKTVFLDKDFVQSNEIIALRSSLYRLIPKLEELAKKDETSQSLTEFAAQRWNYEKLLIEKLILDINKEAEIIKAAMLAADKAADSNFSNALINSDVSQIPSSNLSLNSDISQTLTSNLSLSPSAPYDALLRLDANTHIKKGSFLPTDWLDQWKI